MNWSTSPIYVCASAWAAIACGTEGNRAPLCGQEGIVCEVVDTSDTGAHSGTDGGETGPSGVTAGDTMAGAVDADSGTESGTPQTSSTDGDSSDTGSSSGGVDLTDPPPGFPTPEPFGDSVLETDLIGTWTLPTDGSPVGYAMAFEITDEGRFEWREYDDACDLTQLGAGWIWVEGSQLVMLFGAWVGPAPWPVEAKYGWAADPPFLIRAAYAPVVGHIAVTLPPSVREAQTWAGRGYVRTVGGMTAQDVWVTETELWTQTPGAEQATIIARDRTTLDLSLAGVGDATFQRWWFDGGKIDPDVPVVAPLVYSDDGGANAVIAGVAHKYLGNRMATFAVGENFLLGGEILCE